MPATQNQVLNVMWTPAGNASCSVDYEPTQNDLITTVYVTCPIGVYTITLTNKRTGQSYSQSFTGPLSPATQSFNVKSAGISLDNIGRSSTATFTAQFGWSAS